MSNDEPDRSKRLVIWPSSLLRHFLDPVPNLIQLSQIGIPKPLASHLQLVLESIESRDKLVGSGLQRAFGIEFAFAREIHDCEQQVADLIVNGRLILRSDRPLRYTKFFVHLCNHVADFGPVEMHS